MTYWYVCPLVVENPTQSVLPMACNLRFKAYS
jgi:hypothetical protein